MSQVQAARSPIRRVAVIAKSGHPDGARIAGELRTWLDSRDVSVTFERRIAEALSLQEGFPRREVPHNADLIVVIGGDGTLLSAARSAVPHGIPILGVNFGSLGFLTELQPDELFPGMENVLAGNFEIEERWPIRVRHHRDGEPVDSYVMLNDAVVTKSALARMIDIVLKLDGEKVARYTSDGLIVSTPTGSTAYNLSAGGPILDPRMSAFVVSPICPHTMNQRPLVIPGSTTLEVTLGASGDAVYLTLDGQIGFPFEKGDHLVIDQNPEPARLVRVSRRSFYEILRRKLRWGER